jgi:hypothetical protein
LILVIGGTLPKTARSEEFFDYRAELCGGEAFNLRAMAEANHKNCRDQEESKKAADAAKEPAVAIRADFPAPVNLNPLIYFVRSDVHALICRTFRATARPPKTVDKPLRPGATVQNLTSFLTRKVATS